MMASPHQGMRRYVPHRGRMSLLDRVVAWDSEHILAETSFAHRDYGVRHGLVLEPFQVECVAQAAAALMGLLSEGPRPGLLVSVNNFAFHRILRRDEMFAVRVSVVRSLEGFLFVEGGVYREEECLSGGDLTLYVPGKEESALAPHPKD